MKEAVFFVVNMRISLETVNPTKPRKYERVPCVGRGVPAVHRSRRHSVVSQTHSTAELCAVKSADHGSCILRESKVPTQGLRTQMTFCLGQESVFLQCCVPACAAPHVVLRPGASLPSIAPTSVWQKSEHPAQLFLFRLRGQTQNDVQISCFRNWKFWRVKILGSASSIWRRQKWIHSFHTVKKR